MRYFGATLIVTSTLAILCAIGTYILYQEEQVRILENHERTTRLFSAVDQLQARYRESYQLLSKAQRETVDLNERLRDLATEQKEANEALVALSEDLESAEENFEKFQEIDRELLQKYSKVFFLNENYVPSELADVDPEYLRDSKQLQFHGRAIDQLHALMKRARGKNIDINIASAYRSFEYQQQIKAGFVRQFGSGANRFSADQGFSEHQLGTTVDFSTESLGGAVTKRFEDTDAFAWLVDNAHRYGFVMSYPEGNAYYLYEPWHWRFVGEDLARDLHRENKFFYDLEQREINEYLFEIFES